MANTTTLWVHAQVGFSSVHPQFSVYETSMIAQYKLISLLFLNILGLWICLLHWELPLHIGIAILRECPEKALICFLHTQPYFDLWPCWRFVCFILCNLSAEIALWTVTWLLVTPHSLDFWGVSLCEFKCMQALFVVCKHHVDGRPVMATLAVGTLGGVGLGLAVTIAQRFTFTTTWTNPWNQHALCTSIFFRAHKASSKATVLFLTK